MPSASCTQCQKRKQRCSRDWPCSNCQTRNVSHLCKFAGKRSRSHSVEGTDHTRSKKLRPSVSNHTGNSGSNAVLGVVSTDLFLHPILVNDDHSGSKSTSVLHDEVAKAVLSVPPRYLCDALVNNFIHNVNFIYYSLYPPRFFDNYTEWWKTTSKLRNPAFTCLLLRVCAYSAQYLTDSVRSLLETNLGEDISESSQRFHNAAQKLSTHIRTGCGGLTNVQQLFLAAPWYKSECRFKEVWHALATAIREGQEICLQDETRWAETIDLERELKRRMWCLLCAWDFQVSSWLGRPLLVDHDTYAVNLPSPDFESDSSQDLPSPFATNVLQYQLCRMLHEDRKRLKDQSSQLSKILQDIEAWKSQLPSAFATDISQAQLKELPSWAHQQRLALHAIATKSKLDTLRQHLFKSKDVIGDLNSQCEAIETGLQATALARELFKVMTVANAKAYLISCVGFESSATLAAAMIHDRIERAEDRQRCLNAISDMLNMLHELQDKTRLGKTTYGILQVLVQSIPLDDLERQGSPFQAYLANNKIPNSEETDTARDESTTSRHLLGGTCGRKQSESDSPSAELFFPPGDLMSKSSSSVPSLLDFESTNFDGLEEVWDWQDLDLMAYTDTFNNVKFRPVSNHSNTGPADIHDAL